MEKNIIEIWKSTDTIYKTKQKIMLTQQSFMTFVCLQLKLPQGKWKINNNANNKDNTNANNKGNTNANKYDHKFLQLYKNRFHG